MQAKKRTRLQWAGWIALAVLTAAAAVKLGLLLESQYELHARAAALRQEAIAAEPRLSAAHSNWRRAVLLRNLVYSKTTVGSSSEDPVPLTRIKLAAIIAGDSPELCAGLTVTYLGLLQAFGIKARLVNLAAQSAVDGAHPSDTHVTTEAFLGNSWVIEDPTFNVHWNVDGHPAGIVSLRQAYANGKPPVASTDGFATRPGRRLADYYLPFRLLLRYVVIGNYHPLKNRTYDIVKILPPNSNWWQRISDSDP